MDSEKKRCFGAKTKSPNVRAIYDRQNKTVISRSKGGKLKRDNNILAPISIEVYYDRQRLYLPTGIKITPNQWNERDSLVIRHQNSISLNNIILQIKTNVLDYAHDCVKAGISFSIEGLKDRLNKNEQARNGSFIDFFYERLMNKPISPGTRKGYMTVYNALVEWGKIKKFSDVTLQNVILWDEVAHSKAVKADFTENLHKRLKAIINDAVKFGYVAANPYDEFHYKRDMSIKHDFLTADELDRFCAVKLLDKALVRARDLFIFQSYTGMSYCDAMQFDLALCNRDNGKIRYTSKRTKTGETFLITLLKPALAVLERNGMEVPRIDEHIYNRSLKTICQLAEIPKSLSSHCGRVTWASTIALGHQVPLKVLQVTMGHSSVRQTELYAKLQQVHVDNCLDELDDAL